MPPSPLRIGAYSKGSFSFCSLSCVFIFATSSAPRSRSSFPPAIALGSFITQHHPRLHLVRASSLSAPALAPSIFTTSDSPSPRDLASGPFTCLTMPDPQNPKVKRVERMFYLSPECWYAVIVLLTCLPYLSRRRPRNYWLQGNPQTQANHTICPRQGWPARLHPARRASAGGSVD